MNEGAAAVAAAQRTERARPQAAGKRPQRALQGIGELCSDVRGKRQRIE